MELTGACQLDARYKIARKRRRAGLERVVLGHGRVPEALREKLFSTGRLSRLDASPAEMARAVEALLRDYVKGAIAT